jgi:hypothetical protein
MPETYTLEATTGCWRRFREDGATQTRTVDTTIFRIHQTARGSLQGLISEQRVDTPGDVIADRADLIKRKALGVG